MGSKGPTEAATKAAESQAGVAGRMSDLASSLVSQSAPWRTTAGNAYSALVSGKPEETNKVLGPQYNLIERASDASQRQAEATMPSGGQLEGLKRYLSLQRAGQKSGAVLNTFQDALQRLATMGWGGTQAGLTAYGGAGSTYGGASQNYGNIAQLNAQSMSGLGSGIGMLSSLI